MEKRENSDASCGTIFTVIIISFLMQQPLHTMSPMTTAMGQMKSKRTVTTIILVVVSVLIIGVAWFSLTKNKRENKPITDEQKAAAIAEILKDNPGGSSVPDETKAAIIKAQMKSESESTLTDEQRVAVISNLNSR